ncbi:MAG: tRNA preQ1(34) S-adenosylmethionine ribosyltransferase-isomerase QueA [Pseudomonadota bacterium]
MSFSLKDFQYDLPEELIAQRPCPRREESRLMVLRRSTGEILHSRFSDLAAWLPAGALLALNDARVVPARLFGRRETGGLIEAVILAPPLAGAGPGRYELECLTRPSRRLKPGVVIDFGPGLRAEVVGPGREGGRVLDFFFEAPPAEVLERLGRMPLPPYIKRASGTAGEDPLAALDRERYQTVYARSAGAVAAPTAGLHFSPDLLAELVSRGYQATTLTLMVGYGTFAPVRVDDLAQHKMHSEMVKVPEAAVAAIRTARLDGRPVAAVGTTVVRSLEHVGRLGRDLAPFEGPVDLFIHPGFEFKVVDHLITNFHLPGSTLVMLASAFAGREFLLEAYRKAVAERYRFFSYGDAMLIL